MTAPGHPNILLYGIGGVYNYGCEAIVRGTVQLLREAWPGASIRYASPRLEDDKRRLKDCEVQVVPRGYSARYSWSNLARRASEMSGLDWHPIHDEDVRLIDQSDAVLSIGGDLYTPGRGGCELPRALIAFGECVKQRGKPYVVWGASVGPFNTDTAAEGAVKRHLSSVNLIASREPESTKYLNNLGIVENVITCADPAYAIAFDKPASSSMTGRPRIGVNLSPLSLVRSGVGVTGQALAAQAATIEAIVRELAAEVVLIPHVHCDYNSADDDRRHLQAVYDAISPLVRERVRLYLDDSGFIPLKTLLRTFDLVVAARMHCAINAICETVPAIFLSYSSKALGMAEAVYGDRSWCIPIAEFTPGLPAVLLKTKLTHIAETQMFLRSRLTLLKQEARNPVQGLRRILSGSTAAAEFEAAFDRSPAAKVLL